VITLTDNPSWLVGVEYDLVSRRHRVDGRRVPSVTQALQAAHPHRFAHVPPAVLRRKAAIGTAVHQAAHYYSNGDLLNSSLATEVQTRFRAWTWFCDTRRVDPILCETVVCSRDLALPTGRRRPYIGRLDFLCRVDRQRLVLLDIKTGDATLAGLQTLAYLDALCQQYPHLIAIDVERWAVVVNEDGRYVVHAFRDDATDARDFRQALEAAYRAPDVEWRTPMADMPIFDLPDEGELLGPELRGFELPDAPPVFDLPDEPRPPAAVGEVLPAEAPTIRELVISPDLDAYLSTLEAAIAPYEAMAQEFARQMEAAPIATPEQLQVLGQQSLVAKEREKQLDELFDPAIRKPRAYLDRVYAVKRRVVQWVQTGGDTAVRRYNARKRELEEADRKAKLEADRRQREAQRQADEAAAAERRRLAQEAALAAQQGNPAAAADLIEQARAVEAVEVPVDVPAPALAPAAAVAGISERQGWVGDITDMKEAIMAAARPDLYREIAHLLVDGELTVGANTLTTTVIATKLRALAHELPFIPSTMFAANTTELKKRADADKDTLRWPGFTFTQTFTPVRRTARR
jgi:hypothetical protein